MLVLIPLGLVLGTFVGSLCAGIAKDGSPFRRDFWV
jgi:heme A synthase